MSKAMSIRKTALSSKRSRFRGACSGSGRVIFPSNWVRITGQGDRFIVDERPLSHACRSCDAAAPTVSFPPFASMLSYGRDAAFQKGVVITVAADRDRSL